jgi:hypothetical protein
MMICRWAYALVFAVMAFPASSATFVVTNLVDAPAGGTLRWAIIAANTSPSPPHVISFNLPAPYRIAPSNQLPAITNRNITITGTNQPGYAGTPIVTLSGTGLTFSIFYGLELAGNGITVEGIVVERFAITSTEAISISGHSNRIQSCLIRSNYLGIGIITPARQAVIFRNTISHNPNAGIRAFQSGGGHNVGGNTIVFNGYGISWQSGSSTIGGFFGSGNVISGNSLHGIYLNQTTATNNSIYGNLIGVDATGTNALGNGQCGIFSLATSFNSIGGNDASYRNVIVANGWDGVGIRGPTGRGNWIRNNYIGVTTNNLRLGNGRSGVDLEDAIETYLESNLIGGSSNHGVRIAGSQSYSNVLVQNYIGMTIGGLTVSNNQSGVQILAGSNTVIGVSGAISLYKNHLSGNGHYGIEISGVSNHSHSIWNNHIGTDIAGNTARPNGRGGIRIHNARDIFIGDPAGGFAPGNLISGNAQHGILIEGTNSRNISIQHNLIGVNISGTNMLNNTGSGIFIAAGSNIIIGVQGRNLISGNQEHGVTATNVRNLVVANNYIGVSSNSALPVRNFFNGIFLTNQVVGATITNNVISGNFRNGIHLMGRGVSNVFIFANRIGVNDAASGIVSNLESGVRLEAPGSVSIGSSGPMRNIIGGNQGHGIHISHATNGQIFISGNSIGVDATGTTVRSNQLSGIHIEFSTAKIVIGGAFTNLGNYISGNGSNGLYAYNTHNLEIVNNYIGINPAWNAGMGNRAAGIRFENSCFTNVIYENVIANNHGPGIWLDGLIRRAFIQANYIGIPRGFPLTNRGNQGPGILVNGSENILYGDAGSPNALGNYIAYNQGPGIAITSVAFGVRLRHEMYGNRIYNNSGIPIDLNFDGVTPNDPAPDEDTGFANNFQNYPVLTTSRRGPELFFYGKLISAPDRDYRIEYFASDPVIGQRFIGYTNIMLPASGTGTFTHTFANISIATGATIFATASTTNEGTSEFSAGTNFWENLTDLDNDGMPNWWELLHGFNPNSSNTPGANADGDAFTDVEEWLAFTDPLNSNSYPVITWIEGEGNRLVTFPSVNERVYRLDRNNGLATNPVWSFVAGPVTGLVGSATITDFSAPADFDTYRVRIGLP